MPVMAGAYERWAVANYLLVATKQHHICQRCGGQLIRSYDDISCLQCGAPHTSEGELVLTYATQDSEALLARQEMKSLKADIAQRSL